MTNPFAPPVDDSRGDRRKAASAAPEESSPGVLQYFPEGSRHHSSPTPRYVFVAPVLVALVVAFVESRWLIHSAILAAVVLWIYSRRRQKKRPWATFTIEGSELVVRNGIGDELLRGPLNEVEDVTLDTKTIERVQATMSSGGVPEIRASGSPVGPAIDNSRIELVTAKDVIPLTDHYTSNIDATDWFSKIRRFLRKNGWTPLDEREK
jgi:preprotein translocase subunit Sec61beta